MQLYKVVHYNVYKQYSLLNWTDTSNSAAIDTIRHKYKEWLSLHETSLID